MNDKTTYLEIVKKGTEPNIKYYVRCVCNNGTSVMMGMMGDFFNKKEDAMSMLKEIREEWDEKEKNNKEEVVYTELPF